jgi:hypothetical protein
MTRRIIAALALAIQLQLIATVAWGADNTIIVTPGSGITLRSRDVGSGVESMIQILGDTSGNALATAPGTGNAVFALPIQGVASGVAVPISGTFWQATQPVSIASGGVASGAYASGAFAAGAGADGWNVTEGAKADAVCGTSTGTCSLEALLKYNNTQAALIAVATAAAARCLNTTAFTTNSYTNGQTNAVSCDLHGNLFVNVGALPALVAGTASIGTLNTFAETLCTSGVCKASSGNLYTISVDAVTATTDLKLLIFNSATLPSDGTVTFYKCISFKGDGTQASFLLSWPNALSFTTGISVAVSSSTACTTKTNVTATISGQVQ